MSKPGAEHTESIRDSLVCLQCSYSLRGLGGDVVTCPECGQRINVAALVTQQWNGPWFRAPLYNVLVLPVAWVVLIPFIAAMAFAASPLQPTALPIAFAILFGGTAVWLALVYVAAKRFGSLEAIYLTMLLHLLCGGYLVGLIGVIVSIVAFLWSDYGTGDVLQSAIALSVCIGMIVAARKGERFVAGRCIRRHLRRLAKV